MNIIFGDAVKLLPPGCIVLELDTVRTNSGLYPTYCVVEKLPEEQYGSLTRYTAAHSTLIDQYRHKNWAGCRELIKMLQGFWGGELDSFYDVLLARISEYEHDPPPPDWDAVLDRTTPMSV